MNNTNVKVGTEIVAKVGCNEVKAVITEAGENGIMARSHKSGKEFRVKTYLLSVSRLWFRSLCPVFDSFVGFIGIFRVL